MIVAGLTCEIRLHNFNTLLTEAAPERAYTTSVGSL